jgi:hypothetical protein
MGREIRKVPANWDHPKQANHYDGRLQPMFKETFAEAAAEWKAAFAAWERGEHPDYCSGESRDLEYWEYNGEPPERAYYRPWQDHEATWFQVWETVSEGTPVTPPFATAAELIDYLATNGDFWDQRRGAGPWNREAAEKFVGMGWAPSMMVMSSAAGTQVYESRDCSLLSKEAD